MKYTKHIGSKFNLDGSFREFRGATIISPIGTDEPIYKLTEQIMQEAKNASYAHKYAFLPPESFHMTNISLYNDNQQFRQSEYWSRKYSRDMPFDEINRQFSRDLENISFPESYIMKPYFVTPSSIKLQPADTETSQNLKKLWQDVSLSTQVYWHNINDYLFHISYAYQTIELNDEEKTEQKLLLNKQTEWIKQKISEIPISKGAFCYFNDMSQYQLYNPNNNNIAINSNCNLKI